MTYPVILGKTRKQLEKVLRLTELRPKANLYLAAYDSRTPEFEGIVALMMRHPRGKWAILCTSFSAPLADVRARATKLAPGVRVVRHDEFVKHPDWRNLIKQAWD